MEQNGKGTLRNFPVINKKSFALGLGISKSKLLGRGTVWVQGEESGKEWDGIVRSAPFRSGF